MEEEQTAILLFLVHNNINTNTDKKSLKLGPKDNLYVEGFASNVFAKADKQDRVGRADINTAKTFYTASIFFKILNQFGEIQPDLEQKQKYAVWKAADIRKALKEGRKPVPGPPGGDKDLSPSSSLSTGYETVNNLLMQIQTDLLGSPVVRQIYSAACGELFPLHSICGYVWENTDGQLSFLRYAISAPAEIFTFAHAARKLAYVDIVSGQQVAYGPENQSWLCLDLLEVLCQLAERGCASSVRSVLAYPLEHCPEVLLLGMSHINTAYNLLQYEVTSSVLPMIIGSGSSGVIFHLWHANPSLVLRGFLDIHSNEPENLSKILGICLELKIISSVLDMTPFSFSIKMAALASEKEVINLEKWLDDNLSANKDAFFVECLKFLKQTPSAARQDASLFQHSGVVVNVSSETSSIFLKALQSQAGQNIPPQLFEEIKRLHVGSMQLDQEQQNGEVPGSSTSDGYEEDVEAEANSYFHRMFLGQLTIDAMVQMLARFKESSEKREQSIFACMIKTLLDEFKFIPNYPERQLKITAVLFGSLIKHQLVTHVALGIALRGVLDALRKSSNSKMFVFGVKALEQFVDRLVEWPQYCNHILQISHLRGTHSELVEFIERILAKISSGHSESNATGTAVDQHRASNRVSLENMQATESSWMLGGSTTILPGQQISSPLQVQQRHQGFLDDRHKSAPTAVSYTKPLLSSAGQPTPVPTHDLIGDDKTTTTPSLQVQSQTGGSANVSSSSSLLRPSRGITPSSVHRQHSYIPGFGSALNIETLVAAADRRDTTIETPILEVQDKVLFMINNISTTNIDAKARELADILQDEHHPWFAQYLVMKRASIEPNFHDLYLKFLDKVNSKPLNEEIMKATYENCKVLLKSELIKSTSEERSLLKNLGSWLGKLTIGRNQVLRAREIDPKKLITEAYEKGLMIAMIPFTSKVLEPCQSSLAYRPPNPWTMSILGLLAEIYALPNLKMNLKFDIEVLFKNLCVDMNDVKPTSLLKNRNREVEGNPDFSNKDVGPSQPQNVSEVNPETISSLTQVEMQPEVASQSQPGGQSHLISQYTAPHHLATGLLVDNEKMASMSLAERLPSGHGLSQLTPSQTSFSVNQLSTQISNIRAKIILDKKLSTLGLMMHFQSILPAAMERAIKETMNPVVQRSVTIAMQSTRELVLKDFAMESDETRIHYAARSMVASLAGSLAHVTCKEPLRVSISNHLRNSLQSLNIANDLLEDVTNDNLELGCAAVEHAASDKAEQAIDGEIAGQLAIRRKHREGVGATYFDASTYTQGPIGVIPESLRPKPGRLSLSQQRVYENFVRYPWQNQSSQSSDNLSAGPSAFSGLSVSSGLSHAYGLTSAQHNSDVYSSAQAGSGFSAIVQPLDLISEEMDSSSAQLFSRSSDAVVQHGSDISSVALLPSISAVPELNLFNSTTAAKQPGGTTQLSPTATERLESSLSEPSLVTGDVLEKYQTVAQKLEILIAKDGRDVEIQGVIAEVPEIILQCMSRDEAALAVAQKVFKRLYENASNNTHVGVHLAILAAIRDVCKLVVKELTSWVIYSDEERKFNKDITFGLIRFELLNLAEYNVHLAKLIDGGRNKAATEFSISLLQTLVVQEPGVSVSELHNLVDALAKLATKAGAPEYLQQLVEFARNPAANAAAILGFSTSKEEKARQSRDKKAPSGRTMMSRDEYSNSESQAADAISFRKQATLLFAQWCRICEVPTSNDASFSQFVLHLHRLGFLRGDEMSEQFFRILVEISVSHCISEATSMAPQSTPQHLHLSFIAVDMYAKLVSLIMKYGAMDQGSNVQFLLKILLVTVRVIQRDAEDKKAAFNPRPYFRLLINWLLDLVPSDSDLESANIQVLTAFANAFLALQPLKVPGFSFAWLELVSHRCFMPKLLNVNNQKGWPSFHRLLAALFKFMEPYLRNAELCEPVHFLYKGTLRVLLVLLHDFPEFVCNYHFSFCDVIPSSCIQMRNVILSAFPRNMRLPDPSTPNLKIDLLDEIGQSPSIFSEVDAALKLKQMKTDIDEYLKKRPQGSQFLAEIKQRLLLPHGEAALAGTPYNVALINSLVLYVGMQAIQQIRSKGSHTALMENFADTAAVDIFKKLIQELDTEGRYLFLNAVANQLRYPNNHTHYFSYLLLYLFGQAKQETIQEQITRVLIERLIVNRPHPWGLLVAFFELIKNPVYKFWDRSFTRIAPEIEKLFESVSRSCGGPKSMDESLVAGGMPESKH